METAGGPEPTDYSQRGFDRRGAFAAEDSKASVGSDYGQHGSEGGGTDAVPECNKITGSVSLHPPRSLGSSVNKIVVSQLPQWVHV